MTHNDTNVTINCDFKLIITHFVLNAFVGGDFWWSFWRVRSRQVPNICQFYNRGILVMKYTWLKIKWIDHYNFGHFLVISGHIGPHIQRVKFWRVRWFRCSCSFLFLTCMLLFLFPCKAQQERALTSTVLSRVTWRHLQKRTTVPKSTKCTKVYRKVKS